MSKDAWLLIFTAVSAIVPSLLLAWYFYSKDVYPEPKRVIWAMFFLGVVIVIPVLLVDWPIVHMIKKHISNPYLGGLADAFLVAAIPEELFKFSVLFLYASRHKEFDEPMDGIVYGVIASLGFATLENVLYSLQGGLAVALMRAVTSVPSHAFWGAIMGYFVGQARFNPHGKKGRLWFKALFWPMVLHGLYDFPLLSMKRLKQAGVPFSSGETPVLIGMVLLTMVTIILAWIWAVKITNRLRREQQAQAEAARAAGAAEEAKAAPGAEGEPATGPASLSAGPVPEPAGAETGKRKPSRLKSWIYVILGFILASAGGLVVLGVGLGILMGKAEKENLVPLLAGTAIIGVLPLVLGLVFFVKGVHAKRDAGEPFAHPSIEAGSSDQSQKR